MPYSILAVLITGSICASAGSVLLKVGATGRTNLIDFANRYVIAGLLLYGVGAGFWVYAMSKQTLISVYPFTVLSFVLVYAAGIAFLGELPSASALLGAALILVGLFLIARSSV